MITTPCWAHQINLIVKKFLTKPPIMKNTAIKMGALINFFRGHDRIMGMLQREMHLTGLKPLRLVRPVLTRWTTHFQACRRLLEVEKAMRALVIRRREDILATINQEKDKTTARNLLRVIDDESFWSRLRLMRRMIEPLAVAALVLQQKATRLDHVLLSLGKLFTEYQLVRRHCEAEEEKYCCDTLMLSLEDRWKKADHDLFIAAVILNPFVGQLRLCFSHMVPQWDNNGLYKMLARIYKRLFKEEAPGSLLIDWTDYRRRQGLFTAKNLELQHLVESAILSKESPNPVTVWLCLDADYVPLVKLALRIFSYVPTSADLERLFSHQSEIEGVKRTSLLANRVADIAIVASDINSKLGTNRKRKYGSELPPGDVFLTSKMQCLYDDDEVDGDDGPAILGNGDLVDEAHSRRYLQGLADDADKVVSSNDEAIPGLITLGTLFDTGMSFDLITGLADYMEQPWAMGTGMIEAEIEYYTALVDPLSTAVVPDFPIEQ